MSFQFNEEQVNGYHTSTLDELVYFKTIIEGPFFNGSSSLLDAGCGEGKVTACIAEHFPNMRIVGCDASKAMIQFASQHYSPLQYSNLSFFEKDICSLSMNQEFDRAICFNCLHWIEDQKQALNSIYRALKKGGEALIIASPKPGEIQCDLHDTCRAVIFKMNWLPRFINYRTGHSFHTEREYRKILEDIGFTVERIEKRTKPVVFQNKTELEALLKAVVTPLSHLSEAKRPAFLDDMYDVLVKKGKVSPTGEVRLEVGQIEMLASKG